MTCFWGNYTLEKEIYWKYLEPSGAVSTIWKYVGFGSTVLHDKAEPNYVDKFVVDDDGSAHYSRYHTLLLTNVQYHDIGYYWCDAKLGYEMDHIRKYLDVTGKML